MMWGQKTTTTGIQYRGSCAKCLKMSPLDEEGGYCYQCYQKLRPWIEARQELKKFLEE